MVIITDGRVGPVCWRGGVIKYTTFDRWRGLQKNIFLR